MSPVPALLVGGRLADRLHLGLGFSFFRFYNDGNNSANNVVTFVPTVAIDAFQAADKAFAFYVKMGLPMGVSVVCAGNNCVNDFAIGFDVAIGGRYRYLFHRHFALGLEGGMAGTFVGVQRGLTDHVISGVTFPVEIRWSVWSAIPENVGRIRRESDPISGRGRCGRGRRRPSRRRRRGRR
jgi:hypothetical protein